MMRHVSDCEDPWLCPAESLLTAPAAVPRKPRRVQYRFGSGGSGVMVTRITYVRCDARGARGPWPQLQTAGQSRRSELQAQRQTKHPTTLSGRGDRTKGRSIGHVRRRVVETRRVGGIE